MCPDSEHSSGLRQPGLALAPSSLTPCLLLICEMKAWSERGDGVWKGSLTLGGTQRLRAQSPRANKSDPGEPIHLLRSWHIMKSQHGGFGRWPLVVASDAADCCHH